MIEVLNLRITYYYVDALCNSGDASNNIDINAMPGLNVYADVFVPRSTEYNQLAIQAVAAEEFGGQDFTIVEVSAKVFLDKQTY